jgi:hypothetical protein
MERLNYIDKHVTTVRADRAATWSALLQMWCRDPEAPSTVRSAFFWLDDATPRRRLALDGQHFFSVYKLVFELADEGPHHTRLSALTWADFPGISGKVYRALVIGTGCHRVAVRHMLSRIAAQAIRQRDVAA